MANQTNTAAPVKTATATATPKKEVVKLSKEQRDALKVSNFKKIGNRRAKNVLKTLNGIKNLANRSAYTYTEDQVTKLFNAIDEKLKEVKQAFAAKGGNKVDEISL